MPNLNEKLAYLERSHRNDAQQIYMQDVLAVCAKSDGEFNKKDISDGDVVDRLAGHIAHLANKAKEEHLKYCDDKGSLKKEFENHFTRLATSEASFYTNKPLKPHEFDRLMKEIVTLAENSPKNFHLLLATFAVQQGDKLLNIAIHVQCGNPPVINAFNKATTSCFTDAQYPNLELFFQGTSQSMYEFETLEGSSQLATNLSVFNAGRFTQCVEICADHGFSHGMKTMKSQVTRDDSRYVFPRADHLVTSNPLDGLMKYNLVSRRPTHVDPVFIPGILQNEGAKKIVETENPLFGTSVSLHAFPEKQLSFIFPEIDEARRIHNKNYISKHYDIDLNDESLDAYMREAIANENWQRINFLISLSPNNLLKEFFQPLINHLKSLDSYSKYAFLAILNFKEETEAANTAVLSLTIENCEIVSYLLDRHYRDLTSEMATHLIKTFHAVINSKDFGDLKYIITKNNRGVVPDDIQKICEQHQQKKVITDLVSRHNNGQGYTDMIGGQERGSGGLFFKPTVSPNSASRGNDFVHLNNGGPSADDDFKP
ncbi:MAG: hypothetical protein A3F13_03270 [Gammaproteobacteria bacterium RIFCSPHIGHO2_12_FULL_40_19]|nr:MAG: hypothetical protein A3F13_03270 [Gammaproteobacteria bacterium RIFCSPHIGHO2_12_FULL_40_19]